MKIAIFDWNSVRSAGQVNADDGVMERLDVAPDEIASDGVAALIGRETSPTGERIPLSDVVLQAPIPRPRRNIFCVGKNYFDHVREFASSGFDSAATKDGLPEAPIVFSKLPDTVIPTGAQIRIDDSVSASIDYEAELAVIIGKAGRKISRENALDHVWGYTIVNDVTARDLQQRHHQWLIGKSQDTFCPMGPWAVTADEIDLADTDVKCSVNGELRQDANTRLLMFDVPAIIASISDGITLLPGDVIATGTPAGVGVGFDPPKFLKSGDTVRIEITGIGVLENPVASV